VGIAVPCRAQPSVPSLGCLEGLAQRYWEAVECRIPRRVGGEGKDRLAVSYQDSGDD